MHKHTHKHTHTHAYSARRELENFLCDITQCGAGGEEWSAEGSPKQNHPLALQLKLIINPKGACLPKPVAMAAWVTQGDRELYGILFRRFITTAMAVCICVTMHFLPWK